MLNADYGWRVGLAGFVVLAIAMIPAAWFAGRVDAVPLPKPSRDDISDNSAAAAVKLAFSNASFVVMTCAYFVCGMQLVFLTTHLPSYLAICEGGWVRSVGGGCRPARSSRRWPSGPPQRRVRVRGRGPRPRRV